MSHCAPSKKVTLSVLWLIFEQLGISPLFFIWLLQMLIGYSTFLINIYLCILDFQLVIFVKCKQFTYQLIHCHDCIIAAMNIHATCCSHLTLFSQIICWKSVSCKAGWSKPPPVLIGGLSPLKLPGQYAKKVVNTGQYESEGCLKFSIGRFGGGLRYYVKFYLIFIEKRKKGVLSLPMALFTLALTSTLQSRHLTLVFFNHQEQNRITIQPNRVLYHHSAWRSICLGKQCKP